MKMPVVDFKIPRVNSEIHCLKDFDPDIPVGTVIKELDVIS